VIAFKTAQITALIKRENYNNNQEYNKKYPCL